MSAPDDMSAPELFTAYYQQAHGERPAPRADGSLQPAVRGRRPVRPLRLEIQGLTSYKQPGANRLHRPRPLRDHGARPAPASHRSSTRSPSPSSARSRASAQNVKDLISLSEDRMRVSFEFSQRRHPLSRPPRHLPTRARRRSSSTASSPTRVEWETDRRPRLRRHRRRSRSVLRMDYDAFVRSVLLPQGEFEQFLAGDRDERRKVLDGLLRLGVYAEMHRRANAMDADANRDANALKDRLDTELADATPDTLKAAKANLKELEIRAKELKDIREKATAAETATRRLSEASKREADARAALTAARDGLEAANKLLATGEATLKDFDARIAALESEAKAANYDQAAHLNLTRCLPLLREIDSLATREKRLVDDIASSGKALAKLQADSETAAAKHEASKLDAQAKREAFAQAQRDNAASYLVQDLKVGDPCPDLRSGGRRDQARRAQGL